MKLFIFSDIHGIVSNLEILKESIEKEQPNKIIVLGDLYYTGPTYNGNAEVSSFKVHEFLQSLGNKLVAVKGNCDSPVDEKASDFLMCGSLMPVFDGDVELIFTHGNEYSLKKNSKVSSGCVLVYGHEHIPYIKHENDSTFVCVGSVSLPKEDNPPTYAIYENKYICIKSLLSGDVLMETDV